MTDETVLDPPAPLWVALVARVILAALGIAGRAAMVLWMLLEAAQDYLRSA